TTRSRAIFEPSTSEIASGSGSTIKNARTAPELHQRPLAAERGEQSFLRDQPGDSRGHRGSAAHSGFGSRWGGAGRGGGIQRVAAHARDRPHPAAIPPQE